MIVVFEFCFEMLHFCHSKTLRTVMYNRIGYIQCNSCHFCTLLWESSVVLYQVFSTNVYMGVNGQVSEWSKELVLRSSVAKRVGSNPTLVIDELLLKFLKLRINLWNSIYWWPGHLEQFIYSSMLWIPKIKNHHFYLWNLWRSSTYWYSVYCYGTYL